MRVLALISDAFGGYGGISVYNQDVLTAICDHPDVTEVIAIPRSAPNPLGTLPEKLDYVVSAAEGEVKYFRALVYKIAQYRHFDFILCAHINFIPIAYLLSKLLRIPVVLEIYGIDAWQPTKRKLSNYALSSMATIISISAYTRDRFLNWARVKPENVQLLPNAIHAGHYGVKPKSELLIERYGLHNKKVLLTLGRIVSQERAKGFDEVLALMPELLKLVPNLVYVIAGEGAYRRDLEQKVHTLGLEDGVIFTGMVEEAEKADLYRLADVYVMPSRGEGFGFVFLEAMACGVPTVASKVDGSREAVLDGELGFVVDPDNPEEIQTAIIKALSQPKRIPQRLEYFSFENFTSRLHRIMNTVVAEKAA